MQLKMTEVEQKGHCVKCKEARVMVSPQEKRTKTNRLMLQGECSVCKTKVTRFIKDPNKKEPEKKEKPKKEKVIKEKKEHEEKPTNEKVVKEKKEKVVKPKKEKVVKEKKEKVVKEKKEKVVKNKNQEFENDSVVSEGFSDNQSEYENISNYSN